MENKTVTEGTLLWEPSEALKKAANVTEYMIWLKEKMGLEFHDYNALWQWSVTEKEDGCPPWGPFFLVQHHRLGHVEYLSEFTAYGRYRRYF